MAKFGMYFVRKEWKLQFIDDDRERWDSAGLENICTYINPLPPSASLPSIIAAGLQSDASLFADAAAISSLHDLPSDLWFEGFIPVHGTRRRCTKHSISGYINVAVPPFDLSQTCSHNFKGLLKVHPAHIATTFYRRLLPRGQEKGRKSWWFCKQKWETVYMHATGRSSQDGGVCPPL
ncbi:hypothetical protein MMC21_008118 [Puttea exsequens]|nr:hypothetical protein [Puttea exsequens]